jgi:hypothetical protein
LSVEEIQRWAGLGPAGLIAHAQPTQTGMRMRQAHPYPAAAGVQEEAAPCSWEVVAQLLARDLRETGSSSWCSHCSICVDSREQQGRSDQGRDAWDGVDEQSRVPRTRVCPSLPLYLAPLGLAARGVCFWARNLSHSLSLLEVLGAASLRLAHTVRRTCVERSCISVFLTVGNDV